MFIINSINAVIMQFHITRQSYGLRFARAVHSRHPFPPIGDAAYRPKRTTPNRPRSATSPP